MWSKMRKQKKIRKSMYIYYVYKELITMVSYENNEVFNVNGIALINPFREFLPWFRSVTLVID